MSLKVPSLGWQVLVGIHKIETKLELELFRLIQNILRSVHELLANRLKRYSAIY